MKKNSIFKMALLAALVVVGLAIAACQNPSSDEEEEENKNPPIQVTFTIEDHPTTRDYVIGNTIEPLAVSAVAPTQEQQEALTYQWYSNTKFSKTGGTVIGGATEKTFIPPISNAQAGEYFYYVVVSSENPKKDVASSPARIRVLAAATTEAPTAFTIDGTHYNYVRGFGGTGAFMFRKGQDAGASPDVDEDHIDKLMGPEGIEANILRIMCQDDYENLITNKIQGANGTDVTHWQDNAKNYFAVIRRANSYKAYVFANPWTAPAEMKVNGDVEGGAGDRSKLRTDSYVAYANHLRSYLKWLNDHDAPIYAIGILNEPDWGGSAHYEGMRMTGNEMRDWFRKVGHFTTQEVTNEGAVIGGAESVFATDVIPGFGGGQPTHHVLTMNGDTMGDPTINDPVLNDTAANTSNRNVELFGRHFYAQTTRYEKLVGKQNTPYAEKPDRNYNSGRPEGWNDQREIWMTEFSTEPSGQNPVVYTWPYVFDVLNLVDHSVRVNDESAFCYWYSHTWMGFVSDDDGVSPDFPRNTITTRGRAFAHYPKFAKETWRLGVTRTKTDSSNSFPYNPTPTYGNGDVQTNLDVKISAYEDRDGRFISVVMFTPVSRTGTGGHDAGDVQIVLPDGFVAKSAYAMKSTGAAAGEWWQDDPVVLAANGKSATVNLPRAAVLSVKFMKE
jgi:O-glycosyl hydrolase